MITSELLRGSKVGMKEAETNTKDRGRSWEIKRLKTRPGSRRSERGKTTGSQRNTD